MKKIGDLSELADDVIIVIGNFDGVHQGHQLLLNRARSFSLSVKCKLCVVSFIPHPKILFGVTRYLLTDYVTRGERLQNYADYLYNINFDQHCASLSALNFLKSYLSGSHVKGFFIGYDFALGKSRTGDFQFFLNYTQQYKLYLQRGFPLYQNQSKVSSSEIRQQIEISNFANTNKMLGYNFKIEGVSVKGKGLGKTIGIPTINIKVANDLYLPSKGVYFTKIRVGGSIFKAVTNIGINPTTDSDLAQKIETHIIEPFNNDVEIGESIEIEFILKIRKEKKFKTLEQLSTQIKRDICFARDQDVH